MRVALLTGGGDCPGLNAVIYAAVRKGIQTYGDEFIGFLNGWRGVLDNSWIPLTLESTDGIQLKGGTILHSSRTNVKKIPGGIEKVQLFVERLPGHLLRAFVASACEIERIFYGIPIEIFLIKSPATVNFVVAFEKALGQILAQRRG